MNYPALNTEGRLEKRFVIGLTSYGTQVHTPLLPESNDG